MQKHILPTTCLAALMLLGAVPGQNYPVPTTAVPTTGGCNVIPFGNASLSTTWANQRYQCMAMVADLGGANTVGNICDIAWAPCGTTNFIRHFDTIEVVLGQTTASTMSTTFSANLVTNVQTVLKATNYDWHQTGGAWNRLGFDQSYLYIASRGNLVVQITVTGAMHVATTSGSAGMHTASNPRLYNFGWTGTAPTTGTLGSSAALIMEVNFGMADLHEFGQGCKGANGVPTLTQTGSAQLGNNFSIVLSNAPATSPLYLNLAVMRMEPAFDLGLAGAPGCNLYLPVQLLLAGVTNSSGQHTFRATVPNNRALQCARLYSQFFPFDKSNALGLTASNYGRALLGN